MSVAPEGTARALAVSARALAVLVRRADAGAAIVRYAIPEGTLLSATPVSAAAADELDIAGNWIVYHSRRQIHLVGRRGGDRLLAIAIGRPIGVSIEGRRVAWAENAAGLHRIRTATAPG
jgi:hypothetical protein